MHICCFFKYETFCKKWYLSPHFCGMTTDIHVSVYGDIITQMPPLHICIPICYTSNLWVFYVMMFYLFSDAILGKIQ